MELPLVATPASRGALVARARLLAWASVGWHALEATVAVAAGVAAGSVALVGFGADSVVEAAAGGVVVWRFGGGRAASEQAERRAQRLVALSFLVVAAFVALEAVRALAGGDRPAASPPGIALATVTLLFMPLLAASKARLAERLRSPATRGEGRQNLLCAYLSGALLAGLVANAALGWWWADPAAALAVAAVALREARTAWRGEACCDDPACCR